MGTTTGLGINYQRLTTNIDRFRPFFSPAGGPGAKLGLGPLFALPHAARAGYREKARGYVYLLAFHSAAFNQ